MRTLSTDTLPEKDVSNFAYHHGSVCLIGIVIDKRAREQQNGETTSKRAKTQHTLESGSQALDGNARQKASPETTSVRPTKNKTASPMSRVQREPTPDSRHIARMLAQVAKITDQANPPHEKSPSYQQ